MNHPQEEEEDEEEDEEDDSRHRDQVVVRWNKSSYYTDMYFIWIDIISTN